MILAGDVGGTKCTFTLFTQSDSGLNPAFRLSLPTKSAATFEAVLGQFRNEAASQGHDLNQLKAAAFGIAGAVVGDRVLSSNLPWPVERKFIATALNLATEKVLLLNDLVAAAASLAHLDSNDLLKLNDGIREPRAPMALIAAGTGLGEAILFWDGQRYQISPSEASLTDFAPRNDREFLLLQSLRHRMPRVVTEEVVSGRGFRAIHQIIFPGVQHAFFDEPGVDAAAMITQQALTGSCTACAETLQIWTEAYGAEAGNMALRVLPFGGVYVAGGIALKILPTLKEGGFVRAFSDKMKLSSALAKIPIYVILNEDAPVIGAAYEALAFSES
ncbi:MAG: glucokinase [Acidobacteria bacterium]|nr:MAG: glucokinase [Acidobacteriota bacterium]